MGYIDQNLMNGETILYRAQLHWAIFLGPIVLFLFGLLLAGGSLGFVGWILMFLAVVNIISAAVTYSSTEFALTSRRVMLKVGFLRRKSLELMLPKVESIGVDQGILGRMLGYGTIVVTGTGGTRTPFPGISQPLEFRRQVQNQLSPA